MSARLRELTGLLWPVLVAVLLVVFAFLPGELLEGIGLRKITLSYGILSAEIPITTIYRFGIIIAGVVVLWIQGQRDYSAFFPDHFKVAAYFDDDGISESLKEFSLAETQAIRLASDWRQRKSSYFKMVNADLAENKVDFAFKPETIARGEMTFRVRKIGWGTQKYEVTESKGFIEHSVLMSDNSVRRIGFQFEIVMDAHHFIEGTLKDVYLKYYVVITPKYKQVYRISPSREIYHHSVMCVTKLRFFPYINIGRTVYFRTDEDGMRYPIGYGVYSSF
jgi:hypothetical protein